MDQATLEELLECSVCMNTLDQTSKVLPCQHTFCRRCLDEIVATKSRLHCPECRTPVTCRVEDLPSNILLVRLLESIKTRGRGSGRGSRVSPKRGGGGEYVEDRSARHETENYRRSKNNAKYARPCAKALFSYDSQETGDLTFQRGDIIELRRYVDENWFEGSLNGQTGYFPVSYVQVITALSKEVPTCRALYDFIIHDSNEKDCLTFSKDQILIVIRRIDDNWAEGRLGDRIGIFPLAFVELNESARWLINRPATPSYSSAPSSSSSSSAIMSHDSTFINAGSTSTTFVLSNSFTGAATATAGSAMQAALLLSVAGTASSVPGPEEAAAVCPCPKLLPPNAAALSAAMSYNSLPGKRPSIEAPSTSMTVSGSVGVTEGVASGSDVNAVYSTHRLSRPLIYEALYDYKPEKEDEIELRRRHYYSVVERCHDGWFKGCSVSTGIYGIFPGNYVKRVTLVSASDCDSPAGLQPDQLRPNHATLRQTSAQTHIAKQNSHVQTRQHDTLIRSLAQPPGASPKHLYGTEQSVTGNTSMKVIPAAVEGVDEAVTRHRPITRTITNITQAQLRYRGAGRGIVVTSGQALPLTAASNVARAGGNRGGGKGRSNGGEEGAGGGGSGEGGSVSNERSIAGSDEIDRTPLVGQDNTLLTSGLNLMSSLSLPQRSASPNPPSLEGPQIARRFQKAQRSKTVRARSSIRGFGIARSSLVDSSYLAPPPVRQPDASRRRQGEETTRWAWLEPESGCIGGPEFVRECYPDPNRKLMKVDNRGSVAGEINNVSSSTEMPVTSPSCDVVSTSASDTARAVTSRAVTSMPEMESNNEIIVTTERKKEKFGLIKKWTFGKPRKQTLTTLEPTLPLFPPQSPTTTVNTITTTAPLATTASVATTSAVTMLMHSTTVVTPRVSLAGDALVCETSSTARSATDNCRFTFDPSSSPSLLSNAPPPLPSRVDSELTLSPLVSSADIIIRPALSATPLTLRSTLGREICRCVVPYPPQSSQELELRVGDLVQIIKKRDNGWFRGLHQRTGKTGLFPGSFVEST